MNKYFPKIAADIIIQPFDSSSIKQKYLVSKGERRFVISEEVNDILKFMDGQNSFESIYSQINTCSSKNYTLPQFEMFIKEYLVPNGIIEKDSVELKESSLNGNKEYVHLKISIFSRNSVLCISDLCKYFYKIGFVRTALALFVITSFICFSLHPISFSLFNDISISQTSIAYILFLFSLLLHEIGHASAARHLNILHNDIGVGIYFIFIVFFTDVSYAWSLNRKERLLINIGGIYFQTIFLIVINILYLLTRIELIYYSIIFILFSMLTSLNPFMKFDGYWILSDLIGINNLSKKVNDYMLYLAQNIFSKKKINPVSEIRKKERKVFYFYFFL